MSTLLKKSVALFATAAILASTSVTAFAADEVEEPAENSDKIVWVNGKDVKGSKDGSTPAHLFKSESFSHRGLYTGGKWAVAVTSAEVEDVADFVKLFGDGTKMDAATAKAAKDYASAKIKDGVVTVTAGKKSGDVKVWVYEINNKKIVNETGTKDVVKPASYDFTVKNASSGLVFTTKLEDIKEGVLAKGEKAQKLGYKDGESDQDTVTYYFADKKLANDGTLEIDTSEKNKYDDKVVEAKLTQDSKTKVWSLTLTPVAAGKTNVVVNVKESGKSVKIAAEVVASWKITMPAKSGIKVTANKVAVEVTSATKADTCWVTNGSSVSFDKDVVIGGKTYAAGKTVKITANTEVTLPAEEE